MAASSFQTFVRARHCAFPCPSPPSSTLPNTARYPLNIMVSLVFSTHDLPSNQSLISFYPFILSSDAFYPTSRRTSLTTPPHLLWSTTPTAMPTYMAFVLSSVASLPLYVPLLFPSPPTLHVQIVQILTHPISHTQKRPSPPSQTGSYPVSGTASPFLHWHHPGTPGSGGSGSGHDSPPLPSPQPNSSPVMPLYHPHYPQPPYQHAHQPTPNPHTHLNAHNQVHSHVHAHPQPQSHAHAYGPSRLSFTVRSHPRHLP